MTTTINASNSGSGGLIQTADASGVLALQTAGTTAVTVDTSQNVGIGTTSPSNFSGTNLQVYHATFPSILWGTASVTGEMFASSSTDVTIGSRTSTPLRLATGDTERMRIDTSGNVGIGTTSPNFQVSFGANIGKTLAVFENAGTSVYGIGMGGAGTGGDPYRTKLFSNGTENASITDAGVFSFNSGYGSVGKAYGCRAWVNFNGQSSAAIRGSGNISSITINATGDWTLNFTTAMPDANYSAVFGSDSIGDTDTRGTLVEKSNDGTSYHLAGSLRIQYGYTMTSGLTSDGSFMSNVAIFR
jgi:hypothetical protein